MKMMKLQSQPPRRKVCVSLFIAVFSCADPTGLRCVATSGPKSWVLRSTLSAQLIREMNRPAPIETAHHEDNGSQRKDCGALLAWDQGDGIAGGGVAMKGILFTLLAIILVRDRAMSDRKFNLRSCRSAQNLILVVCTQIVS